MADLHKTGESRYEVPVTSRPSGKCGVGIVELVSKGCREGLLWLKEQEESRRTSCQDLRDIWLAIWVLRAEDTYSHVLPNMQEKAVAAMEDIF